mgnify:CR=1 FL=1|jgi:hypothetical protein
MATRTDTAAASYLPDHPIYIVIDTYQGRPFVAERDVADMSRASVVADIAAGDFTSVPKFGHAARSTLQAVIEVDLRSGSSRDVTAEIASDVRDAWADTGRPLLSWQEGLIADHLGAVALSRFMREVA